MTDEELTEILASMGITVTAETINAIREQERTEQEDVKDTSFTLDGQALLTSEDWFNEFKIIDRQFAEDEILEGLKLAVPPQPPTWIIEEHIQSLREGSAGEGRVYREICGGPNYVSRVELSALTPSQ